MNQLLGSFYIKKVFFVSAALTSEYKHYLKVAYKLLKPNAFVMSILAHK
jgi:hypothetical protein